MRALSKAELVRMLRTAGWDRGSMTMTPRNHHHPPIHRMLVRETDSPPFVSGPHRPMRLPGEREVLKIAVSNRPRLSGLVSILLKASGAKSVIAVIPSGAYWLHNKSLASYLARVPDSARVIHLLRRVGLTDRFQGGFLISGPEFESHADVLASQPFCGGPDVLFAARPANVLITSCHEFDLHLETPDDALAARLGKLIRERGLEVRGLEEEVEESSLA